MREERTVQGSIFDLFSPHEIGRELAAMSAWLDGEAAVVRLVAADRRHRSGQADRAPRAERRCGVALRAAQAVLPAELRGAGLSAVGFGIAARVRSTAVRLVAEEVGAAQRHRRHRRRHLRVPQPDAAGARRDGQAGQAFAKVRFDSTVAETAIHAPTDSSLLWDAVRVMVRLLRQADVVLPVAFPWRDHTKAWPRSAPAPSRTVVATTGSGCTASCSPRPARRSPICTTPWRILADDPAPVAAAWRAEAEHFVPLIERIARPDRAPCLAWREGAGRRQARQSVRTP